VFRNIREGGNDLLFGGKFGALLEFKVTNSTGESEVAVDATKVYKAPGGTNTSFLLYYLLETGNKGRVGTTDVHSGACDHRIEALRAL
jgi:hypothetical protein